MDEAEIEAVRAAERAVWQALADGDAGADNTLLAEDFLGAYPDGFAGRADHAGQLADGPTVAAFEISQDRVIPLGAGHALYAYRVDFTRIGAAAPEAMLVGSVWRLDAGGWRNLYSQDTPLTGASVP